MSAPSLHIESTDSMIAAKPEERLSASDTHNGGVKDGKA